MSSTHRLEHIRGILVRLEETIIFALIERARFRHNAAIYRRGALGPIPDGLSLMEFCLRETERVHARMRRYTSPDEHPFFEDLPAPILPAQGDPDPWLQPNRLNINALIFETYRDDMVPLICTEGDDRQYGSSSVCDVACLQSISQRIHYGKFVAESKRRSRPETLDPLVAAGDAAGLLAAITDAAVEQAVLERVRKKAATYTGELNAASPDPVLDPARVVEIYRRWIIPLNKQVQVAYLLGHTAL